MIGAITFYRMRGSLSSGEYPLLSSGQDLSSYQVASFPRVKYRGGMQASAELPYFNGIDTANVAQIDGSFYWVTEYRQKTAESNQYVITFDYMGPTSLYRSGDTIRGIWQRTPTHVYPRLQDVITNTALGVAKSVRFDSLNCPDTLDGFTTYWIQVTGHLNTATIVKYGGFVAFNPTTETLDWNFYLYGDIDPYPSFGMWMTRLYDLTGLTTDDVDDLSISRRCPFSNRTVTRQQGNDGIVLLDTNGSILAPSFITIDSNRFAIYRLDESNYISAARPAANVQYVDIPLSENEKLVGKIGVWDWNKNEILTFEMSKFWALAAVRVYARMHSGTNGIYCLISCDDNFISIPEGKLPYFGNTAATYRAYAMETDRQAMENALSVARYNRETSDVSTIGNTIAGIANNVMVGSLSGNPVSIASGVLGGATSGIMSAYENSRAQRLSVMQAYQDRALTEKRSINQPSNGYNVSYGDIYAYMNELNPLRVCVTLPYLSDSYYDDWFANFGYPAEGQIDLTCTTGYYKGKLVGGYGGMFADRCNETFANGFKFVNP